MNELNLILGNKVNLIFENQNISLNPVNLGDILEQLEKQKSKEINELLEIKEAIGSEEFLKEFKAIKKYTIDDFDYNDVKAIMELFEKKLKESYSFDESKLQKLMNIKNIEIIAKYISESFSGEKKSDPSKWKFN